MKSQEYKIENGRGKNKIEKQWKLKKHVTKSLLLN